MLGVVVSRYRRDVRLWLVEGAELEAQNPN